MEISELKIGVALTGSFCTIASVIEQINSLVNTGADVIPIMSEMAYSTDTRFGRAADIIEIIEKMTNKKIICSIKDAEPIGPKNLLDVLVIAPCTGNTLSKMANGINDTTVTMAAKAHLRNKKPLVIGVSTNDALSTNAKNMGMLLNTRNMYFIPFTQDDYAKKSNSLIADMTKMLPTIEMALQGQQIQPILG